MRRTIFKEITNDHGTPRESGASNNFARYILTSAFAKDMLTEYLERYNGRQPSSKWFNKHFNFKTIER